MTAHEMMQAERMCLHSAARDLHTEFRGIFGTETIESLLLDSYAELAATATVTRWLVTGAERFAPAAAPGPRPRPRRYQRKGARLLVPVRA